MVGKSNELDSKKKKANIAWGGEVRLRLRSLKR